MDDGQLDMVIVGVAPVWRMVLEARRLFDGSVADVPQVQTRTVRFRTVGDITCTCPVDSPAATAAEIVLETLAADVSERGATRMDDKTSDASMEKRKKDGYF
jgi:3'-phosphoadenosine 5'-phosphosulfate sulfotransferase (PAPS reductase)/FAD synthetase